MYALYDDDRIRLVRLSGMLVCGGLAVLPMTLPPGSMTADAARAVRHAGISVPAIPQRLEFPRIAVDKDPFVPDTAALIPTPSIASNLSEDVQQGQDVRVVLPANAGAEGGSQETGIAPPSVIFVRGIVLGDQPQALIDTGSGVKVFALGDRVAGELIKSIDAGGVTLASGVRLKIASGTP